MKEAISFGWETMKKNIGFFIGLIIIATLIKNIPSWIGDYAKDQGLVFVSIILNGAAVILALVVELGKIKISLKFCKGIKGEFDDLLSSFDLLINFIAAAVIYMLIIVGGLFLLIVPGIIWGVKFSLFPYFMVEKELGPIEALKASAIATNGAKTDLLLFGMLLGLINIAGALFFLIGLFATLPTSMVAYAYVYRKLALRAEILNQAMYPNPEI
jgi:uncharacterized membrane protein